MNQDPTAAALLELLRESKEQVQFLGELGVEAIGLATSVEASEPVIIAKLAVTAPALKPKPLPAPSQTAASQPAGQTQNSAASPAGARPQSALFSRIGSPAPALAPSAETLEQI